MKNFLAPVVRWAEQTSTKTALLGIVSTAALYAAHQIKLEAALAIAIPAAAGLLFEDKRIAALVTQEALPVATAIIEKPTMATVVQEAALEAPKVIQVLQTPNPTTVVSTPVPLVTVP